MTALLMVVSGIAAAFLGVGAFSMCVLSSESRRWHWAVYPVALALTIAGILAFVRGIGFWWVGAP